MLLSRQIRVIPEVAATVPQFPNQRRGIGERATVALGDFPAVLRAPAGRQVHFRAGDRPFGRLGEKGVRRAP